MADLAAGAAGEVFKDGKRVVTFAISNILYLKDLNRNYKKLKQEVIKLKATRKDLEIRRFKTKSCIRDWIARALTIESQVEDLEIKYNNKKKHRWKLLSLANLGKEMELKCQEVCSHRKEGDLKKKTAVMELPEPVKRIRTLKLEENSSFHKALQHVLGFLEDKKIRRIGIWGMVGTGKTTVLQNLNNHEKVAKMFDMVIYVTVSKEWSEKGVQDAILRRLKLDVDDNADVNDAASIISEELKKNKCLILLDEVWDCIDLNRIMGIDENLDSKVVLASRYQDICCLMEAEEFVDVKPLSHNDAWNIFQKKVGHYISNRSIEPLARGVVDECHGLPLLIDIVAQTFKTKGENEVLWKDGLNKLKRLDGVKLKGMDEVLKRLQICYDDLKDDEEKPCFLYGALYPAEREIDVDYLLECWKAEGFINDASNFRSARMRGHSVLNELFKVSLLERSDNSKCVKMNKVLRKMALRISSQNTKSKFLVKPPEEFEDFPKAEEWEQASRISLTGSRQGLLPETPDCSGLLTLLLRSNMHLTSIPKFFFQSMSQLKVLDLHGTEIALLPSSLSNLIYLKALYLNSCFKLEKIPSSVKALTCLEVLDIRKTKLNLLQIGSLVSLKCLRLSLCNFDMANYTEAQVSTFDLLEELNIDVGSLEEGWDKIVDPVIKDIVKLKKLTSLRFCFPKVDCLGVFVQEWPVWEEGSLTFHFAIGCHNSAFAQILESIDHPGHNILKLANGDDVNPVIMKVLMETNALGLIDYGVSSLSDFGIENMNRISNCLIKGCSKIKTIIDGDRVSEAVLQSLENLHITDVPNLENIWQGPVQARSLSQLTTVTLSKCPKLKMIFSEGMIRQFLQLKHLRVEECYQIEKIIMESKNTQLENQALPELKTLVLFDLPKLTSIWAKDSLQWPFLQEVKISKCSQLKSLPFNKVIH
ncbi:disease resistance protein RPS2-like [Vitis riparia]|uniref:disease resistance protein RPS2-like n=1 Tax=Vitis riparia TaxID=96939 RepID=UPI00155A2D3B|nr:disease resistance protein RPS2-like [Vitis riparia]XP_034701837.1 disease resistance protein RPS2-like [Vitis riparia]